MGRSARTRGGGRIKILIVSVLALASTTQVDPCSVPHPPAFPMLHSCPYYARQKESTLLRSCRSRGLIHPEPFFVSTPPSPELFFVVCPCAAFPSSVLPLKLKKVRACLFFALCCVQALVQLRSSQQPQGLGPQTISRRGNALQHLRPKEGRTETVGCASSATAIRSLRGGAPMSAPPTTHVIAVGIVCGEKRCHFSRVLPIPPLPLVCVLRRHTVRRCNFPAILSSCMPARVSLWEIVSHIVVEISSLTCIPPARHHPRSE